MVGRRMTRHRGISLIASHEGEPMRIAKNLLALFAVSLITDALAVAPSTSALAAGGALWVSSGTISGGNGTSCNAPGFNSIQDAIAAAAANSTIIVCTGTYTEQLTITKALTITAQGAVTVQLPATPANDTTSCAAAVLATIGGAGVQDGVSICGNVTVSMTGLTVDAAWPAGTCNDTLYGILVGGNATLKLTTSSIIAAGPQPINGCQGGNGIEIGQAGNSPNPGPAT